MDTVDVDIYHIESMWILWTYHKLASRCFNINFVNSLTHLLTDLDIIIKVVLTLIMIFMSANQKCLQQYSG